MYERSLEEIRASHIIVTVKPGATAQDTAAALKKINEVLELAKAGKDFGELAVTYLRRSERQNEQG